MTAPAEITKRMREALRLKDPMWDVGVGTPEYKILEAVGMAIADTVDRGIVSDFSLDFDSKSGVYLDRFAQLLGASRLAARRATGTMMFSRVAVATATINIQAGTQVYRPATANGPQMMFQTTVAGEISIGGTDVEIPIEAVVAGLAGNVPANDIIGLAANISGISAVTNPSPTTGGLPLETDTNFRKRMIETTLRSVAGTSDAFVSACLQHPEVSQCLVIGNSTRLREQVQFVAGSAASQLSDVKYVYNDGREYVGTSIGFPDEDFAIPGVDYTFVPGPPASITLVGTKYVNGDVVEFETEHTPTCSRNEPAFGVTNYVDIFVGGDKIAPVTDVFAFSPSKNIGTSPYLTTRFQRDSGVAPTSGNKFIPLSGVPLFSVPSTITIGVTTYTKDVDYWVVRDRGVLQGSVRSWDGLEWKAASLPATGASVTIEYTRNVLIRELQDIVENLRVTTTDLLIHRAKIVPVKFHLAVMYEPGASSLTIQEEVEDALSQWIATKPLGDNVQVSDVIDIVRNVSGIDNLRFIKQTEAVGTAWGMQTFQRDGTTANTNYAGDLYVARDELAALHSVNIITKARNSY